MYKSTYGNFDSNYTGFPKLPWPLKAIQTDELVGLIGLNKVLPALAFKLISFGKPEYKSLKVSTVFHLIPPTFCKWRLTDLPLILQDSHT